MDLESDDPSSNGDDEGEFRYLILPFKISQYKRAYDHYTQEIKLGGQAAMFFLQRAAALAGLGNFEAAAEHWTKALWADSVYRSPKCQLAAAQLEAGCYAAAIESCREALKEDPGCTEAYCVQAEAEMAQTEYDDATGSLEKALELDPECREALFLAARLRFSSGNQARHYSEALHFCQRAIETYPATSETYCLQARYHYEMNEHKEALECCKKALEFEPECAEAYCLMGISQMELEECYETEMPTLQRALDLDPRFRYAHFCMGVLRMEEAIHDEAIVPFRKLLAVLPRNCDLPTDVPLWTHCSLAECQFEINDFEGAVESLHKALEIDPVSSKIYHELGKCHVALDDHRAAARSFRQALKMKTSRAWCADVKLEEIHFALGKSFHLSDDFRRAQFNFRRATEINPKHEDAYYWLGLAQAELRDYRAAVESFRKANELNASFEAGCRMRICQSKLSENGAEPGAFTESIKTCTFFWNKAFTWRTGNLQAEERIEAIKFGPTVSDAYCVMGMAKAECGEQLLVHRMAIKDFRKAIEADPRNTCAAFNLDKAYVKLNDYLKDKHDKIEHFRRLKRNN